MVYYKIIYIPFRTPLTLVTPVHWLSTTIAFLNKTSLMHFPAHPSQVHLGHWRLIILGIICIRIVVMHHLTRLSLTTLERLQHVNTTCRVRLKIPLPWTCNTIGEDAFLYNVSNSRFFRKELMLEDHLMYGLPSLDIYCAMSSNNKIPEVKYASSVLCDKL